MKHKLKYLIDNFKKEAYCAYCGQDNPDTNQECPQAVIKSEPKLPFVSGLPVDNFR